MEKIRQKELDRKKRQLDRQMDRQLDVKIDRVRPDPIKRDTKYSVRY